MCENCEQDYYYETEGIYICNVNANSSHIFCLQVSEEVECALVKLGPARLLGRHDLLFPLSLVTSRGLAFKGLNLSIEFYRLLPNLSNSNLFVIFKLFYDN